MSDSFDSDDEEVRIFLKGLRRYITSRALLIYLFVGIATVVFGFIFYYLIVLFWDFSQIGPIILFILIMAGFFIGLAIGTKYTNILLVLPFFYRHQRCSSRFETYKN